MSVYPQSVYGQSPYGAVPGYPTSRQTIYQQYYQPPPPPPPPQHPPPSTYHIDPTSFRREFSSRLSNLTFNSRIHIQDLSLMAQDFPQYANAIVQSIDQHIRQVPAWMKLPGFYLLDAIAKNVYEAYAAVFSRIVVSLFVDTYFQVDASTRIKMEEMLLTWRTAGPDYSELFGPDTQIQLQTAVWGDQSVPSKEQVLAELQFTLGQMERALQATPHDRTPQAHIHVLHQLQRLVERGVSQGELRQILDQLRSLARSALPPPITRPPPRQPAPQTYAQPSYPSQQVQPTSRPYPQPGPGLTNPSIQVPPVSSTLPASNPATIPANLDNLFASLVHAGYLSTNATTSKSGSTDPPTIVKESTPPGDMVNIQESAIREYRCSILAEPVKLTTADLARVRPRIVDYLYDRQSSQCKQCGVRFPDTKLGKKNMDDHLDMHFRQNSKLDQGRGHSRSWYICLEDWLHDASRDGKGLADGLCSVNTIAERTKLEAELRAKHVVVPPGAEAQVISCPICKETLKSEFLEEDEEWVWRNAVKKDDKIYHATCRAEALASTSSLVAKLRSEKAHGSRSATPEVQPVIVTESTLRSIPRSSLRNSRSKSPSQVPESKVAGVKRKVEHTDSNVSREANGTPPYKRMALPNL